MKLLIAGCGDLGTEVALRALAAGHRVHGLRRRPELLPDGILPIAADLAEPLPELPTDVDTVVLTAAADRSEEAAYRRAYLAGPQRLLAALEDSGAAVRRVLLVSSTAVYGVTDGAWVDEDTPTAPTSATARVIVEAEKALGGRPGTTVLRLAGIYGPGRTRLVEQVRAGRAVVPDPPVHSNRIHRDDAAAAILHLLGDEAPAPLYLGVDDDPAELGAVLDFLADELEVARPPRGPVERRRGGDKRCTNARLRSTGFDFAYPDFRAGYRAVLAGDGSRHP